MPADPFDMRDVRRLQRQLAANIPVVRREARAVTMRGAVNIKNDWRSNARASSGRHAPAYPNSVGFDFGAYGPDIFMAVIGPNKAAKQGALGNLLEYGSVKNPPHNDGGRALDAELPRFEAQIQALADRGLVWL